MVRIAGGGHPTNEPHRDRGRGSFRLSRPVGPSDGVSSGPRALYACRDGRGNSSTWSASGIGTPTPAGAAPGPRRVAFAAGFEEWPDDREKPPPRSPREVLGRVVRARGSDVTTDGLTGPCGARFPRSPLGTLATHAATARDRGSSATVIAARASPARRSGHVASGTPLTSPITIAKRRRQAHHAERSCAAHVSRTLDRPRITKGRSGSPTSSGVRIGSRSDIERPSSSDRNSIAD